MQWLLILRKSIIIRHSAPAGLGTRKSRENQRKLSTWRNSPLRVSLLIFFFKKTTSSRGSPRHETPWLNGGGGLYASKGPPRRGGPTPLLVRSSLSLSTSTIADARCDECSRKRGKCRGGHCGSPHHSTMGSPSVFPFNSFESPDLSSDPDVDFVFVVAFFFCGVLDLGLGGV